MATNNPHRHRLLHEVAERFVPVFRTISTVATPPFHTYQLNRTQVAILFSLSRRQDGMLAKHLAEELSLTRGAVSQYLDAMQELGLIERQEDAQDRRSARIVLSKKALQELEIFRQQYVEVVEPLFRGLEDNDLSELAELLSRIKTDRTTASDKS